jgi:hypothetical protein
MTPLWVETPTSDRPQCISRRDLARTVQSPLPTPQQKLADRPMLVRAQVGIGTFEAPLAPAPSVEAPIQPLSLTPLLRSWLSAAGAAIVFGMVSTVLAGCSATLALQEPTHLFHPYVADVSPRFQVVDSRPPVSTTPRQVDQSGGSSLWFYGDEQFSPRPVKVVSHRFALAFPNSGPEVTLVITELEIHYQLARVGQWVPGCSILLIDCFTAGAMIEANKLRNIVRARLSGRFDSIAFDASYSAEYEDHSPDLQEDRVLSALQVVIDKALAEIVERLNPGTRPTSERVTPPELPRPWYMPTPSQIGQ